MGEALAPAVGLLVAVGSDDEVGDADGSGPVVDAVGVLLGLLLVVALAVLDADDVGVDEAVAVALADGVADGLADGLVDGLWLDVGVDG